MLNKYVLFSYLNKGNYLATIKFNVYMSFSEPCRLWNQHKNRATTITESVATMFCHSCETAILRKSANSLFVVEKSSVVNEKGLSCYYWGWHGGVLYKGGDMAVYCTGGDSIFINHITNMRVSKRIDYISVDQYNIEYINTRPVATE